jgi:hypothetical protein
VFSIFSSKIELIDFKISVLDVGYCRGAARVFPRLVGFPAWPPGLVPIVDPSKDRLWLLDRQEAHGAI